MVMVKRLSVISGKENEMEIPADPQALKDWAEGKDERLIQVAFPDLTEDQREFLVSGSTPEEWAELFPPESL